MVRHPHDVEIEIDLARNRKNDPICAGDRAAIRRFLKQPTRANWNHVLWRTIAMPAKGDLEPINVIRACRMISSGFNRETTRAHAVGAEGPIPSIATFVAALRYATH